MCFGQHRYHERRAIGQKVGSPHTVLQDSVRMVPSMATRLRRFSAVGIAPNNITR